MNITMNKYTFHVWYRENDEKEYQEVIIEETALALAKEKAMAQVKYAYTVDLIRVNRKKV